MDAQLSILDWNYGKLEDGTSSICTVTVHDKLETVDEKESQKQLMKKSESFDVKSKQDPSLSRKNNRNQLISNGEVAH